jgi:hypothetical protein
MCDYSLHHVASTPAQVGDKLVTTPFPMSGTRGFAAEGRPDVVVCIPPGAELAFEKDVGVNRALGLLPSRKIAARVARFRQVNMDQPYAHHDALEFPDGLIVHLTSLALGQRATVLQLPAQPKLGSAEAAKAELRVEADDTAGQPSLPLPSPHREIV